MKTSRFPKTERHTTSSFLMRVPVNLTSIATAILSDFLKCRIRCVYRDKSTDRPRRYFRSTFWARHEVTTVSGFCLKKDATHADLYLLDSEYSELRKSSSDRRAWLRKGAINQLQCALDTFKALHEHSEP